MLRRIFIPVFALAAAGLVSAQEVAPPPLPPSPVEPFRQWLQMRPEEREKQLAEWPEEKRRVLAGKLEVYGRMSPEERERRLAMLDLRYYMTPLLGLDASPEREARVAAIPPKYQETIRTRLEQWDRLPQDLRRRMIENEMALQYLTRLRRKAPPLPPGSESAAPGQERQAELQKRLHAWQTIPPEERRDLSRRLHEFFELPREERQRTLQRLSEKERQEIQRSLEALNRMSPEQRRACIQSFSKLANMSPPEQILFLHSAARWQAMTPEERQTWKNLVHNLPPLPPGGALAADPSPPLPATAATTNGTGGK